MSEATDAESSWGWIPLDGEENKTSPQVEEKGNVSQAPLTTMPRSHTEKLNVKSKAAKVVDEQKQIAVAFGSRSLQKGITSSPSFQELENAIGATLALGLHSNDSDQNLEHRAHSKSFHRNTFTRMKQPPQQQFSPQQYSSSHSSRKYKSPNIDAPTESQEAGPFIDTKSELSSFINESESRALLLFHSPSINPFVVKNACQKYGVLYYMRPEFHCKGVTFFSYFDQRSACAAYASIAEDLGSEDKSSIHYSVMLHAANNADECRLVVRNFPAGRPESEIQSIFSRYGQLRSIQRTFDGGDDSETRQGTSCDFIVEYFNIQDARLAASELCATSSQIWGTEAEIVFANMDTRKQQLCRQLLAILSRWRTELSSSYSLNVSVPANHYLSNPALRVVMDPAHHMMFPSYGQVYPSANQPLTFGHQSQHPFMIQPNSVLHGYPGANNPYLVNHGSIGMHGQRSMLQHPYQYASSANSDTFKSRVHGERRQTSAAMIPIHYEEREAMSRLERPQHHNGGHAQQVNRKSRTGPDGTSDADFSLDIERIESGADRRTTIMIRNIPNKYTQASVLEEINTKYSGLYDFFYLPIDFKNRCNVGYAFINFMDPKNIVSFFEDFNGQRWKNFNSEKVCALTFARIQGKQSMIARFQNSSLLEKDDEYKPLLFYSSGPDRGKPEPFIVGPRYRKAKDSQEDKSQEIEESDSTTEDHAKEEDDLEPAVV